MPNCQTVVGPHISHGLNTKTNSCRAEEQTGSCQCGSYQTNKLCGASLGKSTTQICIKLKKKNFLRPAWVPSPLHRGLSLHDEKNLFPKLIQVQYGDGGRFPYRGGPLHTLVMGRTSVELFRFPHRNCKKNKKWMSTWVFQTRRWNIFIKKFWSLTTCSHCTSSLWMCLITTYRPVRSTLVTAGNAIRICMLLLTGKLSLFLLPAKTDPKSPPLTISSFVYSASKWATHAKIHAAELPSNQSIRILHGR